METRAHTTNRLVSPINIGDHVVVCGAGPAGLTAAYLLAKAGHNVTVLESSEEMGGISRTVQYKDYRFDIGGHRFFTQITPVQQLWDEILPHDFIDVPRLSRIHYDGKYFDYPLKAVNALRGLGLFRALRIVWSYSQAKLYPNPVEENFEQWVVNRFGYRLYETFFKTYTEKVWGIPCTEIRAEWAAQRIQGLSLARAILNATAINRRSNDIKTLIHTFRYPRLGPGQLWEACRDRIVANGGRVLTGQHVTRICVDNERAIGVTTQTNKGQQHLDADHVINTLPLRSLVRALDPPPPPHVQSAAEGLTYRDFIIVALILDKPDLFPDNWIYIHTPGVQVGRIQNFRNWSAAMVPDPGRSCLGMEYFCFRNDSLWASSDNDLLALASRELQQLGLAGGATVVDGTVIRAPKAYPIYDASYRTHLNVVRQHIDAIPNLHTIGRNGMHKYNNQDHSMLTAILAVDNMHGATHDLWAVNTDFEYHEEQKISAVPMNAPPVPAL